MRISDWSSDVCSSDLLSRRGNDQHSDHRHLGVPCFGIVSQAGRLYRFDRHRRIADRSQLQRFPELRSEEHTSELQSLMRISYAVFCLKTKNTQNKIHRTHTT